MKKIEISTIAAHVIGWLIFLFLPIILSNGITSFENVSNALFSKQFLAINIIVLAIFYINAYILIPRLYFKKKIGIYFLSIAAIAVFSFIVLTFFKTNFPPPEQFIPKHDQFFKNNPSFKRMPPGNPVLFISFVLFLLVWAISTALTITKKLAKNEKVILETERDRKAAEISFLRSQINPHFLFNTLNNIYALSLTNSNKTSPAIMRLSKIMRYIVCDIDEEFLPLEKEIICTTDYIELQKLRLSPETVTLNFKIDGSPENKLIAPLIFLPFVENAFKYGISNNELSTINISITISDNKIEFYCFNKIINFNADNESTQIGIENVRRRLDHLYKNKYQLKISNENQQWIVHLLLEI